VRTLLTLALLLSACDVTHLSHDAAPTADGGPAAEGDPCGPLDAGTVGCMTGLACCYPCGVPGCQEVCTLPCDPQDDSCVEGCRLVP
jgi:hypothetical protein